MSLLSACADPGAVRPCDTGTVACEPQQEVAYDGIDQDCDGLDLVDVDDDGWPAAEVGGEDCDDGDPEVNPYADEVCNGIDDDCDGLADGQDDSLTDGTDWCPDVDGDSYGAAGSLSHECSQPQGYVADCSDCDDGDAAVNPGATEVCNGTDDDCDGLQDDDDSAVSGASTWYADADGDGYGDADSALQACDQPTGYVSDDSDCDDGDAEFAACEDTGDGGCELGTETCPAESCAEILADQAEASDGDYYLDPTGSGSAEPYACDMSTDGGGWTEVVSWDRWYDGDSQADFEARMTEMYNNMTDWSEESTCIQWSDNDFTGDTMSFEAAVEIPNGGESLLDVFLFGYSYDDSSTFFSADVAGAWEEVACVSYMDWNCSEPASCWSKEEQAFWPYTCSTLVEGTKDDNPVLAGVYQVSHGGEVGGFQIASFIYDKDYGDYSQLYWFSFWVR